jgi:hypothetical protein
MPKNFEGFDLKESKVEALFDGLVNKNGYKYMQCCNLKLISYIKHVDGFSSENMVFKHFNLCWLIFYLFLDITMSYFMSPHVNFILVTTSL